MKFNLDKCSQIPILKIGKTFAAGNGNCLTKSRIMKKHKIDIIKLLTCLTIIGTVTGCAGVFSKRTLKDYSQLGQVNAIVKAPEEENYYFLGTTEGIFLLKYNGDDMKISSVALRNFEVNSLLVVESNGESYLYAGTFCCGLVRFNLNKRRLGRGFQIEETYDKCIHSIRMREGTEREIWVSAIDGIYVGKAGSLKFEKIPTLPEDFKPYIIFMDNYDPEVIRLTSLEDYYLISADGGKSWELDPTSEPSYFLHSWHVKKETESVSSRKNQEQVICWRAFNVLLNERINDMIVMPDDPRYIILGTLGDGLVYVSRIRKTWTVHRQKFRQVKGMAVFSIYMNPTDQNELLVGSKNEIFHTVDGGETWKTVFNQLELRKS